MAEREMLTLKDITVAGRRVLLRLDLNVEETDVDAIASDHRIQTAVPVIRQLIAAKARIIILVHRGRPQGHDVSLSNEAIGQALEKALQHKVLFVPSIVGETAQHITQKMKDGDIVLLDNLRFDPRESENDADFARELAKLGDVYVNDAFANCHRAHASIDALARLLPAAAGPLLVAEVAALHKAFDKPARPLCAIIGGSKISTKLTLLENIITKVDVLLVGGAMANTFLAAEGINVQKSFYEPDLVPIASTILGKAHTYNCQLVLPYDVVVASSREAETGQAVPVTNIPNGMMVLDIGPATLVRLQSILTECHTVLWNGPVGLFENAAFANGTHSIARLIAERTRAGTMASIAGGGDTVAALNDAGVMPDFSYVSTAGGAFLEYLEGKELPGLAALKAVAQNHK